MTTADVADERAKAHTLSRHQLRELLRLRSQVGQLHQTVTEKAPLAKRQAKLKAAVKESEKQVAEEQAAANYWPKEQLAFAGYTDPESTMKSLLWAMKK